MKTCKVCNKTKELEEFYKSQDTKDGHMNKCKSCKNSSTASWRASNKDRWNRYMRQHRVEHPASVEDRKRNAARARKSRYGITQEQYDQMLIDQNHACAICLKHQEKFDKRLYVDHHHDSGKVRGLLCHKCNYFLGYIGESVEVASNLLTYLKKHT